MSKVHVHRVDIQFGDCDPAGIVFFPSPRAMSHCVTSTAWAGGCSNRCFLQALTRFT